MNTSNDGAGKKLLDEFRRESEEYVAKIAEGNDGPAAIAYRLEKRLAGNPFEMWIADEVARGTSSPDAIIAFGNVLGMHAANIAAGNSHPDLAAKLILTILARTIDAFLSGKVAMEGIEFDPLTGEARHVTFAGVLKERRAARSSGA